MPQRLLNNPQHWRQRAEEARAIAGQLRDEEARRIMRGIADGYERMARHAEDTNAQAAQQKIGKP